MPPTAFSELYKDAGLSPSIAAEIDGLLLRKMAGDEMDFEPKIKAINSFLEQQIEHCLSFVGEMELADVDEDVLDELFREMLERVWERNY